MSDSAKRLVAREQVLAYVLCALFVGFFVAAEVLGGKLFRFTLFGLGPGDVRAPKPGAATSSGIESTSRLSVRSCPIWPDAFLRCLRSTLVLARAMASV